jgi:hypothetical protein
MSTINEANTFQKEILILYLTSNLNTFLLYRRKWKGLLQLLS